MYAAVHGSRYTSPSPPHHIAAAPIAPPRSRSEAGAHLFSLPVVPATPLPALLYSLSLDVVAHVVRQLEVMAAAEVYSPTAMVEAQQPKWGKAASQAWRTVTEWIDLLPLYCSRSSRATPHVPPF
jgi:hypothetical protein